MFNIDIQILTPAPIEASRLETAVLETLTHNNVSPPASLSVVLADDTLVQSLNAQYRGFHKTTDVLSFTDGTAPADGLPPHVGDVIISVPQATRQSIEGETAGELVLLTVHGVLHLLGYDHADRDAQVAMWQAQHAILTKLNNPILTPDHHIGLN